MSKNKKTFIKYGVIILVVGLLIVGGLVLTKKDEVDGKMVDTTDNNYLLDIVYDIVVEAKGEVKHPGIYTLPKDTRVQDLINLAGGFTVDADTSSINLASKLSDGIVVNVPAKHSNASNSETKININTATVTELCSLPGIGEAIATRIVDYRTINGYFSSIEEIKNVSGIGDALFEKIKDNITI